MQSLADLLHIKSSKVNSFTTKEKIESSCTVCVCVFCACVFCSCSVFNSISIHERCYKYNYSKKITTVFYVDSSGTL